MIGAAYKQIFAQNLKQSVIEMGLDEFILQQDNDPKHTSNVVKDWLYEKNIDVLPWPPQSPDMNSIEHVLTYMKMCLRGKGKLNKKNLKEEIV
ncbi:TCB2 [Hepatospora eriocheir]|uniref:TCB2 n=1 Tax=Hepatospora eriocheir TaxID=1081669 RepID=A0A1X0QKU4_9MICR|nr:TCB2 [Hepatospora eriocheir]